jgi:hypothetical protein
MSFESSMSLNIPSSFEVKPPPHSCFNFESILFSASTLADLPTKSRLARSYKTEENSNIIWGNDNFEMGFLYLFVECFKYIFAVNKSKQNHNFVE